MRNFAHLRPDNLARALELLGRDERIAVIAGGTDLLDLMKSEIAVPERVIDLKAAREPELRGIEEREGRLRIGALVTLAEMTASDLLRRRYPVLHQAAAAAATPQLRNAGTLGGNLCQRPRCWYFRDPSFPCLRKGGDTCFAVGGRNRFHCIVGGGPCFIVHPSDLAVALLALDGRIVVRKGEETRAVPIGEFYVLPQQSSRRETVLRPDELVVGAEVSVPSSSARSSYTKFKFRESWDFAVVSVALALETSGGVVREGRLALGGVAPVPWLERNASAALAGLRHDEGQLREFAGALLADADPMEENGFKVPLARNLTRRAVAELLERR